MHTNRENGKKYIGITSQQPEKRWQNGKHYNTQPMFWRAIQKYGWDGFNHDILRAGMAEDEANELEVRLIEEHRTQNPKYGYNAAIGGRAKSGWHHTEEAKKKISIAEKGVTFTEEHKEKIRLSNMRQWRNAEILAKVSGANNSNARPVACTDTGKKYTTLTEAAADTGAKTANISKVCTGLRKTAGGYHWEYAEAVRPSA